MKQTIKLFLATLLTTTSILCMKNKKIQLTPPKTYKMQKFTKKNIINASVEKLHKAEDCCNSIDSCCNCLTLTSLLCLGAYNKYIGIETLSYLYTTGLILIAKGCTSTSRYIITKTHSYLQSLQTPLKNTPLDKKRQLAHS